MLVSQTGLLNYLLCRECDKNHDFHTVEHILFEFERVGSCAEVDLCCGFGVHRNDILCFEGNLFRGLPLWHMYAHSRLGSECRCGVPDYSCKNTSC